ncbi:MAG: hypothetical protein IJD60_01470 [Clostridia bacterium]|nr:hypothetical protein [Clostridia bacterium]
MRLNSKSLKAFLERRKINTFGLLLITALSALITLFGALTGMSSKKVDLMVMVTIAFVVLCFIQAFKLRKSFRTMRDFRGIRKKKKTDKTPAN